MTCKRAVRVRSCLGRHFSGPVRLCAVLQNSFISLFPRLSAPSFPFPCFPSPRAQCGVEGGECESVIVAARAPLFQRRLRTAVCTRSVVLSYHSFSAARSSVRGPKSPVRPSVRLRLSVHLNRCVYCEILALGMECCYQILDGSRM